MIHGIGISIYPMAAFSGDDKSLRSEDSIDSPTSSRSSSLRSRAKQRFTSFRRRKELVERDIITNLGLNADEKGFEAFCDKYSKYDIVSEALREAGFAPCNTIIGIDFTASNEWQGKRSFSKTCLHKTSGSKINNPYQKVLSIIGKTLSFISRDKHIYSYGFGDVVTKDHSVFPLCKDGSPCADYLQVIEAYNTAAKSVTLSGPTNFAPIINKAIDLCETNQQYHILVLIVDGQVSSKCEQQTIDAIVKASNYPLSIIVIGIGDGPFGTMFEYDDGLPHRKFDNLQFVNFHRTVTKSKHEAAFALHALMEVPDQYKAVQQLGFLKKPGQDNNNHHETKKAM